MKAYVLHEINDIRLEEVDMPVASKEEVIVKVENVGICGSDIPRIYTTGAHVKPLIPGHEFAGTVYKCSDENRNLLGKKVGVFPLIPCKECPDCKSKNFETCQNYNYLGSRCNGGFAEYVKVPVWNLIELPENVTFEQAACMEPMSVAVHAIRRITDINNSDFEKRICVEGLGTIGLFVCMFLKYFGFKNVYAICNKEYQKEQFLKLFQRKERCLVRKKGNISKDNTKDITDNDGNTYESIKEVKEFEEGFDFFFECVGRNETLNDAITMSKSLGKIVVVGNPYSDMELKKDIYWRILRKQLTVTGTWNSSFTKEENDDWHVVLKALESGKIEPQQFISHRFKLEDLETGLLIMRDKRSDYTKIMIG